MRNLLFLVFSLLLATGVSAQGKGVVISKVTATWCPNCGTWGWDYFEALREIYMDNPEVCLLGVHHSGDLLNPTSDWFSNNLDNFYQPEFYINNEQVDVLSFNWNEKVAEVQDMVEDYQATPRFINFGYTKAFTDSGEIICSLAFSPTHKSDGDYYFALYVFENNVPNFQSSRGMEMHPNVLRAVMSDNYYGDLYVSANESKGSQDLEFKMPINSVWDEDQLGLLAVMWREADGRFLVENSRAIYNLSLLSSVDHVKQVEFGISYLPTAIKIDYEEGNSFDCLVISPSGKTVHSARISNGYIYDTSSLPAGIYAILLRDGQNVSSKQFIVAGK